MRKGTPVDIQRIRHVLAGVTFPAAKWQLIIHAEDYGADASTRTDLWGLPAGTYDSVGAVVAALGFTAPPARREYRAAPPAQAAGQDLPL
ncbi:hypothetical protein GCM10017691_09160 [Pseudonocardia petroleophila]|uniref:DUF2795 domain-containing protein n=1 Tax=Pseudonocardia petroleophila TaxID=37331 RepID=A0A7G7MJD3_9PSEU|nr:DUF2795 domain-containing protein [Pseudonocardia petroleophila]QNG52894.1 DUF2795 domain-containing protein [Pseudonocardia petroleophila]